MKNVILILIKGINYDLTLGEKNFFFHALRQQSMDCQNYRLSSPYHKTNSKLICDSLYESRLKKDYTFYYSNQLTSDSLNKFLKHKKGPFFLKVDISTKANGKKVNINKKLAKLLDKIDEKGLLEETCIVVTSTQGIGPSNSLKDENLHAPLIVYNPGKICFDIHNSVGVMNLIGTIFNITSGEPNPHSLIHILTSDHVKRFDIYSEAGDEDWIYKGLRGPHFQYFCKIDRIKRTIVEQEVYDLNNDYKMTNNLMPKLHNVSPFISALVQEYSRRCLNLN